MVVTGSRPYRRRQWLVNRQLQLRFVKAMVLVLCVMALAAMAAVYLAVKITLSSFELSHDPLFVSLLNAVCWLIALELVVVTPFVVWFGIRLTHKVAGPLVRINAAIQQMIRGDFNIHLTLRKGDSLVELADAINALAANLRHEPANKL